MATSPSALMPIFRSEAQARILAWLLAPDREQPIATLAPIAGVAQPNTLREVNRLVEGGPPPNDVDVIVVGSPSPRALRRANARLEEQLGVPVQLTIVTAEDWAEQPTGLLQTVHSSPHLTVLDNTGAEQQTQQHRRRSPA